MFGGPTEIDRRLGVVHGPSRAERTLRMIGLRQRRAEDCHHRIANELHHGAVLGEDGSVHLGAVLVQLAGQDSGIRIFGNRRIATNVGHQHRDHERFRFADAAPFAPEFVRDAGRQEPAQRLTLLLAINDRLVQHLQAAQRPRGSCARRLRQLQKQLLDAVVDIRGSRFARDRNCLDRPTLGQHLEELFLIRREGGPLGGWAHQGLDNSGVDHRATGRDLADRTEQLVTVRHSVFQEIRVPSGSLAQQRDGVIRLVVLRQHHDPGPGVAFAHLLGGLDPLALEAGWHPDVGHDHLRRRRFGPVHQPVVIAGDADHLHVRSAADQRPHALADDQVVICQEYGDLRPGHAPYLSRERVRGQGRQPPSSRGCWPAPHPRGGQGRPRRRSRVRSQYQQGFTDRRELAVRYESSTTSVSWIPSEAIPGMMRLPFDLGPVHYDDPPSEQLTDIEALSRSGAVRFINELRAWVEVENGWIVRHGHAGRGWIGKTKLGFGSRKILFSAIAMPDIRTEPEAGKLSVRFVQTTGGRVAMPMPRKLNRPPFVQIVPPIVWTTLAVTINADGTSKPEVIGASPFPRHWIYDDAKRLSRKVAITDFKTWSGDIFGERTPWGSEDSPAFVTEVETALEREMSQTIIDRKST